MDTPNKTHYLQIFHCIKLFLLLPHVVFLLTYIKNRLEKIQYRGLRHVYCDYNESYSVLLAKAGMDTIEELLQKVTLVKIFKCVHKIGAEYLAGLFKFGNSNTRYGGINLVVPRVHSTYYGLYSIRYHGTKL